MKAPTRAASGLTSNFLFYLRKESSTVLSNASQRRGTLFICRDCLRGPAARRYGIAYTNSFPKIFDARHTSTLRLSIRSRAFASRTDPGLSRLGDSETGNLPSHSESSRSEISKRFSSLMDHLQSNVFIAGQRLNDLTGYSGIEKLKKDIENQELIVQTARKTLQEAKQVYTQAINQRSASQREVNELLQRKNSWSSQDLERFTSLYRSDHANEQAESSAQRAMVAAEHNAEEASAQLSASILRRYHEEQIWSDKIRRMSTWGTWGLMGVNVLLFLVFQIGVEPWRRQRLVKGFEEKVVDALEKEGMASHATFAALMEAQNLLESPSIAHKEISAREGYGHTDRRNYVQSMADEKTKRLVSMDGHEAVVLRETGLLGQSKAYVIDLFSNRTVHLRRIDLTKAVLEGTLVGIALTVVMSTIVRQ